jgi:benzoyl-CoA reductase/2-hydroxyglutaryl-CoA dehydratase subunit BcrC/BadD/HgdB
MFEMLGQLQPVYVMEVPNKKTERSRRLWHGEVLAFKDVIEKLTGNEITAEKLGQAIDLVNRRRLALQRLYNLRKVRPVPISGKDALLATQVSFYDDAQRDTQMLNALCDELDNPHFRQPDGYPQLETASYHRIGRSGGSLRGILHRDPFLQRFGKTGAAET